MHAARQPSAASPCGGARLAHARCRWCPSQRTQTHRQRCRATFSAAGRRRPAAADDYARAPSRRSAGARAADIGARCPCARRPLSRRAARRAFRAACSPRALRRGHSLNISCCQQGGARRSPSASCRARVQHARFDLHIPRAHARHGCLGGCSLPRGRRARVAAPVASRGGAALARRRAAFDEPRRVRRVRNAGAGHHGDGGRRRGRRRGGGGGPCWGARTFLPPRRRAMRSPPGAPRATCAASSRTAPRRATTHSVHVVARRAAASCIRRAPGPGHPVIGALRWWPGGVPCARQLRRAQART